MRSFLLTVFLLSLACGGPLDKGGDNNNNDTQPGGDDSEPGPDPTYTAVEINFDDCDGDVNVDTRYPEVSFSTEDGYHLFCWNYASYSRSEPYTAYTATSGGGAGASVDLTWTFTRPVRNLQFYSLGDQISGPLAVVTVFTEDGTEAETNIRGDGDASSGDLTDLSEWDNIVRIEITEMDDPYTVNYDDISFEQRD